MVELKGLHIVRSKGKAYAYAWRGGPRLYAPPGSAKFFQEYNDAIASRGISDGSKFRAQVQAYRASDAFTNLSPTTRKIWNRWLDRIAAHFGDLTTAQFGRAERIRPLIKGWLKTFSDKPRTYDYAKQVLSRVLSHVVEEGGIATNPCEGIKTAYSSDRSDIIWSDEDIEQLRKFASLEVMLAVELAAQSGIRKDDLFRLAWSHIGEDAIVFRTSKSRFKREAVVPLHDELRAVLARIPRRSTVVLTNSRGMPWKGFDSSFRPAKIDAFGEGRDLNFHDLRGTAATKFYLTGISIRTIAEIMGWSEEEVEKIIRRYVSRKAAVQDTILKMRARTGTGAVKPAVKPPTGEGG